MINPTHLKVLLKKDFLTLWRSKAFIIGFIALPIILIYAFIYIKSLFDKGLKAGPLIYDNFKYTSTKNPNYLVFPQFFDYQPLVHFSDRNQVFSSNLYASCGYKGKLFQNYTKIAIISQDNDVRNKAQMYFQNYVLPNNGLNDFQVDIFSTEDNVVNIVQSVSYQPYCFLVNFKNFDTDNDLYDVQYSFPINNLPNTLLNSFNQLIRTPNVNVYNKWFDAGCASLYPYITEFIARYKTQSLTIINQFNPLYIQQMGFTPMESNTYIDLPYTGFTQLSLNFPFFFMIIFKIPYFYITSKIASEKESKAKEGMKMMGLRDSTYYLAWFILYMSISVFTSLVVTIISMKGIFIQVNYFLFFIFCILYSINLFGWALIIVALLPTKRSSGIASVLINFITFYMSYILRDEATPSQLQYGLSVLPNVCMNQIIKQIFFYNFQTDKGLNFSNGSIQYQGFSFNKGLIELLLIAIFYTLLGIYLDQVVPSDFGVVKPWYFLCTCFKKQYQTEIVCEEEDHKNKNPKNFEEVQDSLKKQEQNNECLKIRGLQKNFGQKKAVNGLDLTMYNGQIFALLGHNGAGKTTTLSMLTGLIEPTNGNAEVFGINIFQNMNEVRLMLGVCPQHDILFDSLTPEDHLRLFASFKGTESSVIEDQVQQMLIDIDLVNEKSQLSSSLSGGQKRKLSVAIAMIGNSKIVLLDEPSSGMDTTARRILWEMLKKNKNGKIIILTTHYMDEADILGDRIAIMAEGDVQCIGSSLFLKNRYGVGYNLKISKIYREPAPKIDQFIFLRIKNAKKIQEVSNEILYQLPNESSYQFKQFFSEFDQSLQNLGIRSYGIGITTLEEVFLRIGHGDKDSTFIKHIADKDILLQNTNSQRKLMNNDEEIQINDIDIILENYSVAEKKEQNQFFQHLYQLIRKKVLVQIRDLKTLGIDTLFPIILIIVGLKLATIAVILNQTAKQMSLQLYPNQNVYYNQDSLYIQDTKIISDFIQNQLINQDNSILTSVQGPKISIQSGLNTTQQIEILDDFIFKQVQNGDFPVYGSLFIQTLNDPYEGYSAIVLVNSTQQDTVGVWAGMAHQAFLRQYCNDNLINIQCKQNITVNFINKPFPLDQRAQSIIKTAAGATSGLLMAIAWLMISDSLIQNIVKEKARNVKHQIMISGSSLSAYWLGHYIGDIIFQSFLSIVSIIGYYAFQIDVPQAWVIFLLMIFNNPPFIYFLSLLVQKEEQGSLLIKILYFSVGVIAPIVIQILQIVDPSTIVIANTIKWIFYPFPIYSMTFGYISICNRQVIKVNQNLSNVPDSFDFQVAGPALIFMLGTTVFYWILVILYELRVFDYLYQKIISIFKNGTNLVNTVNFEHYNSIELNDVQIESKRVQNSEIEKMPVRVHQIKKYYGDFLAVNNISFGLDYGECFALLGITGAGKTSCFKCLTGEMYPDSGNLNINGHDITKQSGFDNARSLIGYCPQFDAIFDGLTVLEHLEIYATLKGIRNDIKSQIIKKQISDMDLTEYVDVRANNLSGGNKRKLSVAIAIIGNPPIVFLDEPSTGVDPQAKRFMWNIISKISTLRKKSAVIITTHSMEEAEALCSKMGIMVGGEFKCFGSSQYIKDKYGTGYEIEIKIRSLQEQELQDQLQYIQQTCSLPFTLKSLQYYLADLGYDETFLQINGKEFYEILQKNKTINSEEFVKWEFSEKNGKNILDFLKQKFKQFEILEHFGSSWKLKVSRDEFSIGYMFGMMTEIQQEFNIIEYSVTQTTLEQIFNNFALQADRELKNTIHQ